MHSDQDALESRERQDFWFGDPRYTEIDWERMDADNHCGQSEVGETDDQQDVQPDLRPGP